MSGKKIRLLDGDDPVVEGDMDKADGVFARAREVRKVRKLSYPRWLITW